MIDCLFFSASSITYFRLVKVLHMLFNLKQRTCKAMRRV